MGKNSDLSAYIAEAIATFTLIFIGAGAILADEASKGSVGLVGIAFAHGVAIMTMVYATGHISGGHINPAVTIGMWVTKKIKTAKALGYIISQLAGAVIAAVALNVIFINSTGNLGTPALGEGVTVGTGILVEAILTFFLVFVIFGVAVDKRAGPGAYGLAIGFVIFMDILMGGVLTGGAMNPARAFGPAIISGYWVNHIVYWVGPIVGGIIAAVIYNKWLLGDK